MASGGELSVIPTGRESADLPRCSVGLSDDDNPEGLSSCGVCELGLLSSSTAERPKVLGMKTRVVMFRPRHEHLEVRDVVNETCIEFSTEGVLESSLILDCEIQDSVKCFNNRFKEGIRSSYVRGCFP